MNKNQFNILVAQRLEACKATLASKGQAYAGSDDVLANFKRNAANMGLQDSQVWLVYFMKHIDAITSAIKSNPASPVDKSEGIGGRITDAINYLLLFEALTTEVVDDVKTFMESGRT